LKSLLNLDANASYGTLSGLQEQVWQKMGTLNPSSVHSGGQRARALIEEARDAVKELLCAGEEDRIIFTSGATEANNTAVMLPFWEYHERGQRVRPEFLSTSIEHPSVLEPLARLSALGFPVNLIEPRQEKFFPDDFLEKLSDATKLVSIMLANNETGQILPVSELSAAIKNARGDILLHSDAVQMIGKVPLSFADLGIDILTISGHKIGAFTGTGALIVKKKMENYPLIKGGPQESRWRAGTENVPGIVSLGIAAAMLKNQEKARWHKMQSLRDELLNQLRAGVPDLVVNLSGQERLPNTLSLRIPEVKADDLVVALDLENILISSGSACSSGKPEPSHVLLASGLEENEARETIRISLRADHSLTQIQHAAEKLLSCIAKMRRGG